MSLSPEPVTVLAIFESAFTLPALAQILTIGTLLALLLCAAGQTPTEIAAFLFGSRSWVYRIVKAYHYHSLAFDFVDEGTLQPPLRTSLCCRPHANAHCRRS
jgi:hypothetical protein